MATTNLATQKMVKNIVDGTTPPKKVKNPLNLIVNEIEHSYDGSEEKSITIQCNDKEAVKYTAQSLTAAQKTQARTNIGAPAVADVTEISTRVTAIEDGTKAVPEATHAGSADTANKTKGTLQIKQGDTALGSFNGTDTTITIPECEAATPAELAAGVQEAKGYTDNKLTSYYNKSTVDEKLSAKAEDEKVNNLSAKVTTNETNLANLQEQVDALPTEQDVDDKVKAAIDGVIDGAGEAFDTLKEVADWIASDETGTTALVGRVTAAEAKISSLEGYKTHKLNAFKYTLPAAAWTSVTGKSYSVSSSIGGNFNVTTSSMVKIYPDDDSAAAVINHDVKCTLENNGFFTFTYSEVAPTTDLTFYIEVIN